MLEILVGKSAFRRVSRVHADRDLSDVFPKGLVAVVSVNVCSKLGICHVWPIVLVEAGRVLQDVLPTLRMIAYLTDQALSPPTGSQTVCSLFSKTRQTTKRVSEAAGIHIDHKIFDLKSLCVLLLVTHSIPG